MAGRLAQPPDSIGTLLLDEKPRPALVRGEILSMVPRGARPMVLPLEPGGLAAAISARFGPGELVVVRADVEEAPPAFERPMLERVERVRDLYIGDASSPGTRSVALLRLDRGDGHPFDDLHIRLDGEAAMLDLPRGAHGARTAFVRVLEVGDPVVVQGTATVEDDLLGVGSGHFREAPRVVVFRGDRGLRLFDPAGFEQAAAWDRLSWLGKLAVLLSSPSRPAPKP